MANVLNRTTKAYLLSVNTPDYDVADWIINPDLSGVVGVPIKYWKITGDVVTEMNAEEKAAVDEALLAKTLLDPKYLVRTLDGQTRVTKEEWYQVDNGDGTYSKKAKDSTYSYSGEVLVSRVDKIYYYDGTVCSTTTYEYYTGAEGTEIEKRA